MDYDTSALRPEQPTWTQRGDAFAQHSNRSAKVLHKSAADIRKERDSIFMKLFVRDDGADVAEFEAARRAWQNEQPYLSPSLHIPEGTTVDSLLASPSRFSHFDDYGIERIQYGQAKVLKCDRELFERLQRELATIDPDRAKRQLYQLMHGRTPVYIQFSKTGMSQVAFDPEGRKILNVNPTYSVLDPKTGGISPLCIVLGHEIEHANAPVKFQRHLAKSDDRDLTNMEEFRVIDGYENPMLRAAGIGQRSTHASFLVPLDPEDYRSVAFPYQSESLGEKTEYIRPGRDLRGNITAADELHVTLQRADGSIVKIPTTTLLASTIGNGALLRHGFIERETLLQRMSAVLFTHPAVRPQMNKWQEAAIHRDEIRLSVSQHGLINLHRTQNGDSLKRATLRKTWRYSLDPAKLSLLVIASVAVPTAVLMTYLATTRPKRQRTQPAGS